MKTSFAAYCSGGASTILNFYRIYSDNEYPLSFILYDGEREDVFKEIEATLPNTKVINYSYKLLELRNKTRGGWVSECLLLHLQSYNVDYLFCFGDKILSGNLIHDFQKRLLNFHPSLLPSFPGLNAIDKAISSGVKVLGNTVHYIDEGVDTGEIILQSTLALKDYSDYSSIFNQQLTMIVILRKYLSGESYTLPSNFYL